MKLSLNWIRDYVDLPQDMDLKRLAYDLTMSTVEVEDAEDLARRFDHMIVGVVQEVCQHPNADKLKVCRTDIGGGDIREIVCGGVNLRDGMKVAVACPGAMCRWHGEGEPVEIKETKLRGVASYGMICASSEIGLADLFPAEEAVILDLSDFDAPAGTPLSTALGMDDILLEIDNKSMTNRPDLWGHYGIARELAALYHLPLKPFKHFDRNVENTSGFHVTVLDEERCPRMTGTQIEGLYVKPAPYWMQSRIWKVGMRPINALVDVTNYVMLATGQPSHAYDSDHIAGHIIVRRAEEDETLKLLNGKELPLNTDDLIIADDEGAVGLAGVMGGLDTEVTDGTVDILLEAATFEPGRTSRTSRNLGLFSESSMRYERGVDDHGIEERSAAAAALMVEVAGGSVSAAVRNGEGIVDEWPAPSTAPDLRFRIPRFCAMMGADIPRADIEDILRRLGCAVADDPAGNADVLAVTAPTFRPDLEREIDLYEEVLRLWGMDRIPATLPGGPGRVGTRSQMEHVMDTVNAVMRASGLNETMTYSFAEPGDLDRLRMPHEGLGEPVELINPLNADQSVMRQSIVPGLLRSVAYNQSRGVKNVQLYEAGAVFFAAEGRKQPKERRRLAGVLAGAMGDTGWNAAPAPFDFFDGKGVVESLARELALPKLRFKPLSAEEAPHLQPGRAAAVLSGGAELGWVGELHPLAVEAFEADAPVVAFELDVEALAKASRPARDYRDVPTFPAVSMDVAFVVDEGVAHEKLVQCMTSAGGKLLEDARLFDVYRDEERLGAGRKSMAYALTYRATDRTLTSDEVDKAHERLVKKVCTATGAEVRG